MLNTFFGYITLCNCTFGQIMIFESSYGHLMINVSSNNLINKNVYLSIRHWSWLVHEQIWVTYLSFNSDSDLYKRTTSKGQLCSIDTFCYIPFMQQQKTIRLMFSGALLSRSRVHHHSGSRSLLFTIHSLTAKYAQ